MKTLALGMLRRDLQERFVFRWSLLLEIASTASALLGFYLIDRYQGYVFDGKLSQAASRLGTSYFGYVSLGLAVSAMAQMGVGGVPGRMVTERANRSLEYLMASPLSIHSWAVASGLCGLIHAFVQFFTIFGVAVLILKMSIPPFQPHAALLVLLLSTVPLWCLSSLVLAGTLIFRRGNPFAFALGVGFELLGGVYVPSGVLPAWLERLGELLPITPALRATQAIVYRGAGIADVRAELFQLAGLTLLYLPAALGLLKVADRAARRNGMYCLS